MTVLLGCLAYIVAMIVAASMLLSRGTWQIWHPRLALASWHAAFLTSLVALVFGAGYALKLAHATRGELAADPAHALALGVGTWVGVAVTAIVLALALASSERVVRTDYADRDRLRDVLLTGAHRCEVRGGVVVHTLDTTDLLMCAFRTPEPTVVTSRTVQDLLSPAEFEAVLEHERAHLRQRHHFVGLLALVSTSCLPRFEVVRRMRQASNLLVELIADDAAALRSGYAPLAAALAKMADHTGDPGLAARADRIAALGDKRLIRRGSILQPTS